MPPDRMLETAREVVPDRTTEIVLYCWDDDCPTSGWAARELEADGYTVVGFDYPSTRVTIRCMCPWSRARVG